MNISKIARYAMGAILAAPTPTKVMTAGALGAGLVFSSLVGCGSKTETEEKKPQTEKAEKSAQKDSTQTKPAETKPQEPIFEYTSPKIGEDGIVCADTSFFAGTKKPSSIGYYSDDKKQPEALKYEERFSKDGKLKDFTKVHGFDKKLEIHEFSRYNNKGENVEYQYLTEDGGYYNAENDPNGDERSWKFDSQHRVTNYNSRTKEPYSRFSQTKKYNKDGSYSVRTDSYYSSSGSSTNEFEEFDRNGRLIRKKDLDGNDVVKYTVTPKYDKDGCVIKNDTVWNEERNK